MPFPSLISPPFTISILFLSFPRVRCRLQEGGSGATEADNALLAKQALTPPRKRHGRNGTPLTDWLTTLVFFPPRVLCRLQEGGSGATEADNALLVKQALHLLEDAMEGVELPSGKKGVTRAGDYVYALFGHAGVTFDTALVSQISIDSAFPKDRVHKKTKNN